MVINKLHAKIESKFFSATEVILQAVNPHLNLSRFSAQLVETDVARGGRFRFMFYVDKTLSLSWCAAVTD